MLAEPVKNYPSLFHAGSLFDKFPYLLPNIVCTGVVVFGVVIGALFLEETHEEKKDRYDPFLAFGRRVLACISATTRSQRMRLSGVLTLPAEDEKNTGFSSSESTPRISSVLDDEDIPKLPKKLPKRKYTWRQMFTNQVLLNILALAVLAL